MGTVPCLLCLVPPPTAALQVGISFQQSASTQYFKKCRHWLQAVGRLDEVPQAVVNPDGEAYFNLIRCSWGRPLLVLESWYVVTPRA